MKKSIIICMVGVAVMMSSCRIYKAYERPEDLVTDGLYRDPLSDADTLNAIAGTTFGDLPWRDVFTDTQLQAIIEQALENNADIRSAQLTVEQARITDCSTPGISSQSLFITTRYLQLCYAHLRMDLLRTCGCFMAS